MASTRKYQKARLRRIGEAGHEQWVEVLPSELIDTPAKGDLVCHGCPVLMKRTKSFTRSGTEVPAYLSLYANTEHALDCRLNVETLHAELKRNHPDTVSIEDKVLYLHLPDEERIQNSQSARRRVGAGGDQDRWTETLHSAVAIAKFLKQYEDAGDLLNRLMIRYRDYRGEISVMFWADFCFEARSPQALKYLRRLQRHGDKTPPVAVVFPTKAPGTNSKHRFMRFDTYEKPIPGDDEQKLFLGVAEPLAPDRNWLSGLESESILVLGRGKHFDWSNRKVTEIQMLLHGRWQLASL